MRALEFITGHVTYNPAYTYKFQLKTTHFCLFHLSLAVTKDLEGKDRQRQLLYYETLIRACNKVVYQLVYKGKKFVFLKEPLYLINQ